MVKERSPIMVLFWGLCTLGISWIFWFISTKNEMNAKGADIPTAWIWCIPYVGTIYWFFKYSEGWEKVTKSDTSSMMAFLLLWLFSFFLIELFPFK
ncbi:MAG: DUF4234 domain-containing protein [Candidatus Heimdallarchaeota archaeon]